MRVRLILENGGHTLPKVVELPRVPAVGSTIQVDRERRVVLLKTDAGRSGVDVYLREDADDLLMQITPEAHLAFVELMKRDGWDVEDEEELRVWLTHRINRQDGGPADYS
ncbi:hypothetical protein [Sorangium cellulosum]|uniref:Uncharacterized protein n=1 Tax=Sorangium cellulosum TaxID=56 RepID=A0A150QN97_SORCE|nr:hypothetical protein [Sorangium cellulosum]KYF69312.1 hypothetical protein BE15_05660 [Sorangium cellulosum]